MAKGSPRRQPGRIEFATGRRARFAGPAAASHRHLGAVAHGRSATRRTHSGGTGARKLAIETVNFPRRVTNDHRFGPYEVSLATRRLLVDGRPVLLGARTFDLLLALVENRDRVLAKDELMKIVWPGLVVEENNLQAHVSKLRKVLGADAIATVAGYGYRFTLEAKPAPSGAGGARRTRSNLPAQLSSFVGRDEELGELRSLLDRNRLVTLTGVAGIGKSRLAHELAARLDDAFADGVWLVDLAPLSEAGAVAVATAAALDVYAQPSVPASDAILRQVASQSLLLVLDNCEHLLAECGALARSLLQATRNAKIIATSRESLHVAGEVVYPVPALPTPREQDDALPEALAACVGVALFLARAAAARPGFALTGGNAPAVARICRDLEGIPLALELAAARVRAMSPESIVEHVADRFRLLAGSDATAIPRHQSLRAALDWSYALLSPAERRLLQRVAVFADGFALDAAQAVAAGGEVAAADVLELLSRLVEKSMVAFEARGARYRMLETVRQYALERLAASGEEAAARAAERRFHQRLAIDA